MNGLKRIQTFLSDESGQDLVEYTLLITFVALSSIAIMQSGQPAMTTIWTAGSNTVQNAAISVS